MRNFLIALALVWVSKDFVWLKDLVTFLNTLPSDRAVEAKIVAVNSDRAITLFAYSLVYRVEK